MLCPDSEVFLSDPAGAERRDLHRGRIASIEGGLIQAELDDCKADIRAGQALTMYFSDGRNFMQQPAHVQALLQSQPTKIIALQPSGEPEPAEGRDCFRVSTVISDLTASLGNEDDCPLADISPNGCAILATTSYPVGKSLTMIIRHDGTTYTGAVTVQNTRDADEGRFRHGLRCVENSAELRQGLQRITMAVQRDQLKRIQGAA
jgi:hypothetical protein